jgi:hypothetical protein
VLFTYLLIDSYNLHVFSLGEGGCSPMSAIAARAMDEAES